LLVDLLKCRKYDTYCKMGDSRLCRRYFQ